MILCKLEICPKKINNLKDAFTYNPNFHKTYSCFYNDILKTWMYLKEAKIINCNIIKNEIVWENIYILINQKNQLCGMNGKENE